MAQFCGNDPTVMLEAAKLIQDMVDAVDINIGCPQNIAKKGAYGAYLMDQPELVRSIGMEVTLNLLMLAVSNMSKNLKVPVFCKMRLFPTIEETISFAKMLEGAGCKVKFFLICFG